MKKVLKNVGFTAVGITVGALLWWNGGDLLDEAGNVITQLVNEIERLHGLLTGADDGTTVDPTDPETGLPNPEFEDELEDLDPDTEIGLIDANNHHMGQIRQANTDAETLRGVIDTQLGRLPDEIYDNIMEHLDSEVLDRVITDRR